MSVTDSLEECGRGLALVDALSENWGSYWAESTGKVVWAPVMKSSQ